MDRDLSHVVKAGEQSADDPFEFTMSSESVDRDGDIIVQSGWNLKEFRKNPIALFAHNHRMPIGTWRNVRVEGTGENRTLKGNLQMAAAGTSRLVDEVRSLLEQRILRAVSVGFSVQKAEPRDEDNPWDGFKIMKQTLLETSVVSVPANADAVRMAKSMGISRSTRDLIFSKSGVEAAGELPRESGSYQDILGDPSDIVRERKRLERLGLI